MHDLNTLNRLNAEAFEKSIRHYQSKGRWVLARYEGLTLVSIETFGELTQAQQALDQAPANALQGERATIFAPLPFNAVGRDQSEDRPQSYTAEELAALGNSSTDKTLGDYIHRKI
jgi:hypothetical protein